MTPDYELEQERYLLDVTEMICELMDAATVSKSDLAERLGKSKSHITQLLSGGRNLTLRTLSDVLVALGSRPVPSSMPLGVDYAAYLGGRKNGCVTVVERSGSLTDNECRVVTFARPKTAPIDWSSTPPSCDKAS